MFRFVGEHIINYRGLALDVVSGQDKEGQGVQVFKKHNGVNQRWKIVYVD